MNPEEVRELEGAIGQIYTIAERFGLDPFPVHFELVPSEIMYEFGAYGLPGRFSHWTHGRAYHQIKTMYDYGLSKIYELVINSNPAAAFLLENNTVLQNELVIAHVLGHSDFFKHNAYFEPTNRKMVESARVNAERIRQYEFRHGQHEVESILDSVLSIQEHVDPFGERRGHEPKKPIKRSATESPFEDLLSLDDREEDNQSKESDAFPAEPEKDILYFIAKHAR